MKFGKTTRVRIFDGPDKPFGPVPWNKIEMFTVHDEEGHGGRAITVNYTPRRVPEQWGEFAATFDDNLPSKEGHTPVGYGRTPWEAIFDLINVVTS